MTVKGVKLSFWDSNNFGDALNVYLFRAFGLKAKYSSPREADVIGIGSCIDSRLLLGAIEKKMPDNQTPIAIYGSGFHYPEYSHTMQKGIVNPETLIRPVTPYAVRGEVSKQRLENVMGKSLDDIALGDPGLLISDIFDLKNVKKRYKLGIVAHFTQDNHPSITKIEDVVDNSIVISVLDNPYKVARQIAQCEVLVSSAMHPLIIADGLGVPNKWLKLSGTIANDNSAKHTDVSLYKFDDYYSVFGLKPSCIDLSERDFVLEDIEQIKVEYPVKSVDVDRVKSALVKAFPYSDAIKPLSRCQSNAIYFSFLFKSTFLKLFKQIFAAFISSKARRCEFRRSPVLIKTK